MDGRRPADTDESHAVAPRAEPYTPTGTLRPPQPHRPGEPADAWVGLDGGRADEDAEVPGPLLTSGSRADVFAIDDERVLRRYRSGASADAEAAVVRHVTEHGFPAPEVIWAHGPEIIMARLHGPTLLQAIAANEVTFTAAGHILADLHSRLHAIPAPGAGPGGDVVLHLDLHPANVVLDETQGPSLVDWSSAGAGRAELDVATSALILAEVVVDAVGEYSQAARALLVAFLAASVTDPRPALQDAERRRMFESRLVPGERALVPAAGELVRHYAAVRHPE